MKILITAALVLASVTAVGQTPATPDPTAPTLTPAETLSLSEYDKAIEPLWQNLMELKGKRDAYVSALNAGHPGYQWHDATSPQDHSGFFKTKEGNGNAQVAPKAETRPNVAVTAPAKAPAAK